MGTVVERRRLMELPIAGAVTDNMWLYVVDPTVSAVINRSQRVSAPIAATYFAAAGLVTSVFGRVGDVVAVAGDYTASQVTNVPAGAIAAVTVQAAIDELDTEKQPVDAFLTSIAALGTAADRMIYTTGVDTAAETVLTAFARTILDDANQAAVQTTLGLVAGGTGDIWVEKAGDTMTGGLIIDSTSGAPFQVKRDIAGSDAEFEVTINASGRPAMVLRTQEGAGAADYCQWNLLGALSVMRFNVYDDSESAFVSLFDYYYASKYADFVGNGLRDVGKMAIGGDFTPVTDIHVRSEDAVTAAVTNIATLGHNSSGVPAANFGAGLLFQLESSTTADQDAAQIAAVWSDATHATRTGYVSVSAVNSAAALAEVARFAPSGTTINVNSATALLVEQDGVNDDVLVVDTTTPLVNIAAPLSINGTTTYLQDDATTIMHAGVSAGNFAIGVLAGASLVAGGTYNTFIGYESGTAVTTGDDNTAIGYRALASNIIAVKNTAIGARSCENTTGGWNIGIGNQALQANISGITNVAIGYLALSSSTTTSNNLAIGREALASTTGAANTGIGAYALLDNVGGVYNTAIGFRALENNISGDRNTAIGYTCLDTCTTGSNNVAIGSAADVASNALGATISIGRAATANVSNQMAIGSASFPIHTIVFAGSTGPIVTKEDAVTDAVSTVWGLSHNSTGAPAANFGAGLLFQLESSTTADQDAASIAAVWSDATHATRDSALTFSTVTNAAALAEIVRITDEVAITGDLDVSGHMALGATASISDVVVLNASATFTDIVASSQFLNFQGTHTLTVNNARSARAINASVTLDPDGNNATSTSAGIGINVGVNVTSAGIVTGVRGISVSPVDNSGSATVTTATGINISNAINDGGGSIGTQIGLNIASQTRGTTNYALITNQGNVTFNDGGVNEADFIVKGANYNLIETDSSDDEIWIGNNAASKIGFFGAAAVVQRAKADYNNWAAFGDVVDALVDLGLFDAA